LNFFTFLTRIVDINNSVVTTLVQFVVDNFSTAARPGSESRVESVWVSGQQSMFSAALFIASDWVRDTWAVNFWVESAAFTGVNVVSFVVWVGGDTWGSESEKVDVPQSESAFDNASVGSTLVSSVISRALLNQISAESKTESVISNSLGITISDSVSFSVHLNTLVRVDQISAASVEIVNNFTVSKNSWSVDENLVGIPPGVVQVAPAAVSVDWLETVGNLSGECSAGFVSLLRCELFDVSEERSHGSVGEAEAGGCEDGGFHFWTRR
jgi:hypothetical protein